ncbi:MAG: glycosyltransferase family 2 protein [Ignavibacteria bacterium]
MNESISIIVLNYNGGKYLKNCLESVLNQSYSEFELILFDNNSTDGSIEYVKSNFSDGRIRIIGSKENLGFANGNNEAIKYTSNDMIVLLNNDTVVDKDWLKYLVEALHDKNTIASSYVITEGVDKRYYESNGSVSYLMYNVMNIFDDPEQEFYPNGCSLIYRKSEIPVPFDKEYFYYSEDLYLGLKSRFMGMRIKFVKNSVVKHYGQGTESDLNIKTFYQERNRLLNLYSFFSLWFIIRLLPIIFGVKTGKLLLSIFSKNYSFTGLLKAYLWFLVNSRKVLSKRKELNKIKTVDEKEVIKFITSKLLNHESALNKFINNISYNYSRLVGIKPIEYYQKRIGSN